ncbi:MAG: O-antigen ligase family protein, partial [Chloroflexi bacterium]|nr:O-antigen ligase family protein [Chloroflexota bacterium]
PWLGSLARGLLSGAALLALGLILARGPLTWGTALVLGSIAAVLLLRSPKLGLYGLAFSVPFGSLYELSLGDVTVGASELLVLATLTAWLAQSLANRTVRVVRSALLGAILLYVATLLVGLLPAQQIAPALKELAKWVELALVYALVAGELRAADQRWLVAALLVAGSLEALLGIYQFARQVGPEGFVLFGRYMRAYGTFQQPNPYGGYMGLLAPLAYALALTQHPARRQAGGRGLAWLGLLGAGAAVLMVAALVMSWSRGALVGLAAGGVLVLLAMRRRAWLTVAVVALVALLLAPALTGVLPQDLAGRFVDAFALPGGVDLRSVEVDDANFATVERLAHWQAAWRMFEQRPWTGVGTGQYAVVYPSVALPRWQDPLGHAHNWYLHVLAEGGLLGLAAYTLWLLVALVLVWRAARSATGWRRGLALGALGMLGHLCVHSLVDNLYVHEMYLVVGMVLGLALARPEPAMQTELSPADGAILPV